MSTTFQRSNYRFVIYRVLPTLYTARVYFDEDLLIEISKPNTDLIYDFIQCLSKGLFNLTNDIHALDTNLLVKTS